MEFKIFRTSYYEDKPCEEAYEKITPQYGISTFNSFEAYDKRFGEGSWLAIGTEHKVLPNGRIQRRLGDQLEWYVTIDTLEELIKFIQKYGKLVINEDFIEIYDYYRE